MPSFEITLRSADPIDLGDLGAAGFESLVRGRGIDTAFDWQQDADGRIQVTFDHEATDRERAITRLAELSIPITGSGGRESRCGWSRRHSATRCFRLQAP